MFGKNKAYKKGISDAFEMMGDFEEKQQKAVERVRREVASGRESLEDALKNALAELNGEIFGLSKYLSSREKAALYKLSTPMDINELGKEERQLLMAVLIQLASDTENILNDFQRNYIHSVQQYLAVTNPQTNLEDVSVIGDINSLEVQKAFLRVVLEFMYIGDSNEFTDEQLNLLNCFSVNKKQSDLIEMQVGDLFNIFGAEGISRKYQVTPTENDYVKPDLKLLKTECDKIKEEAENIVKGLSVFLSYSLPHCEIFVDECLSKQSCKTKAEQELRKKYNAANNVLNLNSSQNLATLAYDWSQIAIKKDFNSIKHHINNLRNIPGISDYLNKMEAIVNFEKFSPKLLEVLKKELRDDTSNLYKLDSFNYYAEMIEYDSDSTGAKFFFSEWSADISYAETTLGDDFNFIQDTYSKSATDEVKLFLQVEVIDIVLNTIDEIKCRLGVD